MRAFVQVMGVLAIAIGAGMFSFGSYLSPRDNLLDPNTLIQRHSSHYQDEHLLISAISCGWGIGLMILGTLMLVIPWINQLLKAQLTEIGENSTRTFATIFIWLSIALILTFGVLRLNWNGGTAMSVLLILIALICASATVCTAMVFGWKPWAPTRHSPVEPVTQPAVSNA